jgi:hypothetical protein
MVWKVLDEMSIGIECKAGEPPPPPPPGDFCTWEFYKGGQVPRHIPDYYEGTVWLADLDPATIPDDIQGVYWFNDFMGEWWFWGPGAPNCTLGKLVAGTDYMVMVSAACVWRIPLP